VPSSLRPATTIASAPIEAPPAIISIFLGDQLTDVFVQIEKGGAKSSKKRRRLESTACRPRRRTRETATDQPLCLYRNKFEFRAVASEVHCGPLVALNTLWPGRSITSPPSWKGYKGDEKKIERCGSEGCSKVIKENGGVIFNGNNYADEWYQEAARRGLPNLKTSVEALPIIGSKEVVALMEKYKVLSKRETHSRMDIYVEQYCKAVNVEANLMIEMAKTKIYPAAVRYQGELAATAASLKSAGYEADSETLDRMISLTKGLQGSLTSLEGAMGHNGAKSPLDEAKHFCHDVLPAMQLVRQYADELESIVADDLWPLPTYQEMLFIK
jgi:glutamine synthetase